MIPPAFVPGEIITQDGDIELNAGDSLTFRAREPHSWRNPDARAFAEVLWVITPAPWGLRRRAVVADAPAHA